MQRKVNEVMACIRRVTLEMDSDEYNEFVEWLKQELERTQDIMEWNDSEN